jgi:hypothetical protein
LDARKQRYHPRSQPHQPFGPNSNDGPGGGEFFYDNTRYTHLDAEAGGLLYVPGRDELLGAINNPNTSEYNFGGGIVYYDLLHGNATRNDLTLLDPTANNRRYRYGEQYRRPRSHVRRSANPDR